MDTLYFTMILLVACPIAGLVPVAWDWLCDWYNGYGKTGPDPLRETERNAQVWRDRKKP